MDLETIIKIVTGILSVATVITAMTKTKWDNKIVNILSKILNMLAGNVGKNKNADS